MPKMVKTTGNHRQVRIAHRSFFSSMWSSGQCRAGAVGWIAHDSCPFPGFGCDSRPATHNCSRPPRRTPFSRTAVELQGSSVHARALAPRRGATRFGRAPGRGHGRSGRYAMCDADHPIPDDRLAQRIVDLLMDGKGSERSSDWSHAEVNSGDKESADRGFEMGPERAQCCVQSRCGARSSVKRVRAYFRRAR